MDRCVLMQTDIMGSCPKMEATSPVAQQKIPHFVVKMAQKVPYLEKIST